MKLPSQNDLLFLFWFLPGKQCFPAASPAQALAAGTSDRRGRPTACPQSCRGGRSS